MNRKFYIIIALLALSVTAWGQSDRVKTVETRDSASLVIFENAGTSLDSNTVQGVIEQLDTRTTGIPGNITFYSNDGILSENSKFKRSSDNEIWLGDSALIASENALFQSGENLVAGQTFSGNRNFISRYGSFGSAHAVFSPLSLTDIPSISFWKSTGSITSPSTPTNNSDLSQISAIVRNNALGRFEEIGRIVHVFDSISISSTNRSVGRIDIRLANSSSPQYNSTTRFSIRNDGRIVASLYSSATDNSGVSVPNAAYYPGSGGVFFAAPIGKFQVTNPITASTSGLQVALDSLFSSIPKQSAQFHEETARQYAMGGTGDTTLIDTLSTAFTTALISQDTGYIRNMSGDTVRWQVSYAFFRDCDEDNLVSFADLTTNGADAPQAIPGSRATSEQASVTGENHPGPTFVVDVPPGDAIRLCVYSGGPAAGVAISDLSVSVVEVYRE